MKRSSAITLQTVAQVTWWLYNDDITTAEMEQHCVPIVWHMLMDM